MKKHLAILSAAFLAGLVWTSPGAAQKVEGGPPEFKNLKYRLVGPAIGGRVCRSVGVPGDPLTYYVASAAGGLWKSTDGGQTFQPVFDNQPVASVGSVAVAASDPNVVYAGTGEGNIRGDVAAGNGIYKSLDGGKTWKQVWKQEGQIGTLLVHPAKPDVAFAAVLGHAFGPNDERGVYRTIDGGKTWQKVLGKDRDTGASDVCFDPSNPNVLFAGLWQARRRPWEFTSGGPGSGLYTSHDGGDTWSQLTEKGLPAGPWGKVCVAVAPADGRRVYALIEAEEGGLFRSDDGGDTWKRINGHHYLRQRSWYFSTLTVDPINPDVVWCPTVRLLKSIDGGQTFQSVKGPHHGDHHDLWIDPKNPRRMIDSNDGGVDVTVSGGQTWYAPPLPLAQFYHVAADNRTPYHVSGTMQDFGTASGPSNSLCTAGITRADWHDVGGGETGFTAPDPADPNVLYGGEYGGYISRYDERTRQSQAVSVYPVNPSGHAAEDLRYRFQWTAPVLVSFHDPRVVYHAANVLFRTEDGGKHWTPISPDLTRNDKAKQKWSGGPITGDNVGTEYYDTIFALAESPREKGLIWAGTDDGLVQVTRDSGKTWTNVTANIPGLPEWGTVCCIEASPFDAGTAYVVVDAHRLDEPHPYLFKTGDYGRTWKNLAAGLAPDVSLHALREDPRRKGLLYAGSERGVNFSTDDGDTWKELKLNLPPVPVHDLVVKDNDLVLATHGRSIWIFDDLTPIREMAKAIAETNAHLFPVPPAIRSRYHSAFNMKGEGDNPPRGAVVDYYLKTKPASPITLEILDAQGALVAKVTSKPEPERKGSGIKPENVEKGKPAPGPSPKVKPTEQEAEEDTDPDAPEEPYKKAVLTTEPGVNRVAWDLHYDGAEVIKGAKVDAGDPEVGPLAIPGTYTARLTVEGKTFTTPVVVQADPGIPVTLADLEEQLKLALTLRDDIAHLTRLVERLRSIRTQVRERNELLKDNPKAGPMIELGQTLIDKLDRLEAKLHNPGAEVTYDILAQKGGAQLYSQLSALLDWLEQSDAAPTQGMREVYAEEARQLQQDETELSALTSGDLARVSEMARKLEVPNVIVPTGAARAKEP